ncbi:hypothetical protein OPS25_12865 [Alteromonas ponticola]|uniref:DUF2306 domain-containing protein n=1 Tax=Alteromonas aquimaris TaxID=2998417 RepID=A0ABT3P9G7_9ALTE|nr:hypothetical protein [Alteromonas aquimaris]MCW8109394.1 hypothetical protein [Alteromonas aquimaris]
MKSHIILFAGVMALTSFGAYAAKLTIAPESHWLSHMGAAMLLYAHIGAGVVGILTGFMTSLTVKGGRIHKVSGRVFVVAMFVCYLLAALVAPFLDTQQSTNFVAAILALYLLITGTSAAIRKEFIAGVGEKFGLVLAILITSLGVTFMVFSYQSPNGSFDGSPAQAYVLFVVVGSLAVVGEINVLVRKTLSTKARIRRHLWRMCMSLFIASGSLFFGQAQMFPEWFNASLLPMAFGFFPFAILLIYIVKMSIPTRLLRRRIETV